jgi:hypothetical protein
MQAYEKSAHVREIVARLYALEDHSSLYNRPNITFGTEARNVLLTLILFRSAQRSGCLAGLTLGEFGSAESVGDNQDQMIISVSNHKTFTTHGHANIVVDKELYKLMKIYARHIRPLSTNFKTMRMEEERSPFFITRLSTPLDNGYVSQAIVASWKLADLPREFISVTNFRKVRVIFH